MVESLGLSDQFQARELTFQDSKINGKSRGVAYMEFKDSTSAKKVKEYLETKLSTL